MIQNDVEIEPTLQELDNDRIDGRTGDEAKPDIRSSRGMATGAICFFRYSFNKCKR